MIKIFSIKEIIQASTNILNSQNQKKLNTRKFKVDKEKIVHESKNKYFYFSLCKGYLLWFPQG